MDTFAGENQKLRDELTVVKNELVATREELTTTLARIGAMEHGLQNLEAVESRLDDMKNDYEQLSNLLKGNHLFDSERFRTAIQTEVKGNFGYYWPSLMNDMKGKLWKEVPPLMKEHLEKEMGKLVDEVVLIRSELVEHQQKFVMSGDPTITELKQAVERVEKRLEEFEKARHGSTPKLTPNDTKNGT